MSTISVNQADDILNSIKEYQELREKINAAVEILVWNPYNINVKLGDNLIDSLLDTLEVLFNDDLKIFEWHVFVNEFGKNQLTWNVNGEEIKIDSAKTIIKILEKKNAFNNDYDSMRKEYQKNRKAKKERRQNAKEE